MSMGAARPSAGFELIDHTGDIGLRIWSATEAGIFETGALGLFSLICDVSKVEAARTRVVELSALSRAELFVAWLNELNLIFQLDHVLLSRFSVISLKDNEIEAEVSGESISDKHRVLREVKAATYHELRFQKEASNWIAQVILDL